MPHLLPAPSSQTWLVDQEPKWAGTTSIGGPWVMMDLSPDPLVDANAASICDAPHLSLFYISAGAGAIPTGGPALQTALAAAIKTAGLKKNDVVYDRQTNPPKCA